MVTGSSLPRRCVGKTGLEPVSFFFESGVGLFFFFFENLVSVAVQGSRSQGLMTDWGRDHRRHVTAFALRLTLPPLLDLYVAYLSLPGFVEGKQL